MYYGNRIIKEKKREKENWNQTTNLKNSNYAYSLEGTGRGKEGKGEEGRMENNREEEPGSFTANANYASSLVGKEGTRVGTRKGK